MSIQKANVLASKAGPVADAKVENPTFEESLIVGEKPTSNHAAVVEACIAEHAPTWDQHRPVGDPVFGRKPSGGGTKRPAKGRYLSTLPRNEDGRPLATAILDALGLPPSGYVPLWKPSVREDRALVLWETTGEVSPVRMGSIKDACKVRSLETIVRDFRVSEGPGMVGGAVCRGRQWK